MHTFGVASSYDFHSARIDNNLRKTSESDCTGEIYMYCSTETCKREKRDPQMIQVPQMRHASHRSDVSALKVKPGSKVTTNPTSGNCVSNQVIQSCSAVLFSGWWHSFFMGRANGSGSGQGWRGTDKVFLQKFHSRPGVRERSVCLDTPFHGCHFSGQLLKIYTCSFCPLRTKNCIELTGWNRTRIQRQCVGWNYVRYSCTSRLPLVYGTMSWNQTRTWQFEQQLTSTITSIVLQFELLLQWPFSSDRASQPNSSEPLKKL